MSDGHRVWVYGDHVNTDVIYPGKYTYTLRSRQEIASVALEDLDARFSRDARDGDVIVAGYNWGCGSSREQAVTALKYKGVIAIIAASFSGLYFRNCINQGIWPIVCESLYTQIGGGDEIQLDYERGLITWKGGVESFTKPAPTLAKIIENGGLAATLKKTTEGDAGLDMSGRSRLAGIICAIVTPFDSERPALDNLARHMRQLIDEGCNGILLMGTTGEGPSVGAADRKAIIETAMSFSDEAAIIAATGASSLDDTIVNTKTAFDLGVDAVVTVPPYYYKGVSDEGLFDYFRTLFDKAVPTDGALLGYHIPQVTGIPFSTNLLRRLADHAGDRFAGVKDSSGDLEHGRHLIEHLPEARIFVGTDHVLLGGLESGAAGCITAGANVFAPLAARVLQLYERNDDNRGRAQETLSAARRILDDFAPSAPTLKRLLRARYQTSGWECLPPLVSLSDAAYADIRARFRQLALPESMDWLS